MAGRLDTRGQTKRNTAAKKDAIEMPNPAHESTNKNLRRSCLNPLEDALVISDINMFRLLNVYPLKLMVS
jgi:hypothetical protein